MRDPIAIETIRDIVLNYHTLETAFSRESAKCEFRGDYTGMGFYRCEFKGGSCVHCMLDCCPLGKE